MSETPRTDEFITSVYESHKESNLPDFEHYFDFASKLSTFARTLELELKQSERKARALDWIERNHPRITSWKLRSAEFPGWNWLIQQLDDEKMVSRSIENQESLLSAIESAMKEITK